MNNEKSIIETELVAPTTFSITHREGWDPDHSIDQNLDYSKKILRAKSNNRSARKSSSKVEKSV